MLTRCGFPGQVFPPKFATDDSFVLTGPMTENV
jgi:hypothetical protein